MNKVIYLSGPIGDHDTETEEGRAAMRERRLAFQMAEKNLRDMGHEPLNPFDIYDWYKGRGKEPLRATVMRADLKVLTMKAEEVWLLAGWRESRGALTEAFVASECGIPVRENGGLRDVTAEEINECLTKIIKP